MRVAVIFDNFGPYHLARLRAAARTCEVLGIEVAESSSDYEWNSRKGAETFPCITLFPQGTSSQASWISLRNRLAKVMDELMPDAVAIPGWSSRAAIAALQWCHRVGRGAILMSESTAHDERRAGWKEMVKRRCVGLFSSALVGGRLHADYLRQLGVAREQMFFGYDAVDNDYFSAGAEVARQNAHSLRKELGLPRFYFLASSRFIGKKNLPFLLDAFGEYRKRANGAAWDLVLLGDGPLREQLIQKCRELRVEDAVFLKGFQQYDALPAFYGLASVFVHASTSEQWGLVVNEAAASGLPLIISNRCGCARELVEEGANGFTFDPENRAHLSVRMLKMADSHANLNKMGLVSRHLVSRWSPRQFAEGLAAASRHACNSPLPRRHGIDRVLLQMLMIR